MSLGSIIRERRRELGVTQELVSGRAGISKPYLSNIETGKAKNPPSDGVLRLLERILSFRPGELMRIAHLAKTPTDIREDYEMRGAEVQKLREMLRQAGDEEAAEEAWGAEESAEEEAARRELLAGVVVPVINKVAAGYPHHFTDLDYPTGVAEEYIRCPDVHDPQAFAARVIGDSMEPEYREGDIVIFSPGMEVRSGDDCFIRFEEGEGTTFKRLYEDDNENLRLQPLNRVYPAQIISREAITGVWPALFRIQRVRGA